MNGRLLLYIVVILGCGYMGLAFAGKIDKRINQIKALESIMVQLSFQLGFLAVPFKEALHKVAVCQRGAVRGLMENTVKIMNDNPDCSAGEAFEGALRGCADGLYLSSDELDICKRIYGTDRKSGYTKDYGWNKDYLCKAEACQRGKRGKKKPRRKNI